jgi:hypothetical protein
MRFLLHGKKLSTSRIKANQPLPPGLSRKSPILYGQKCSPRCGCVLRFEASLDTEGHIQAATYHAKQIIVCTSMTDDPNRSRTVKPTLTLSKEPRPLLTECTCSSLHHLAKQVVAQLPHQRNVRNQLEFTGFRSSLAFSHAILSRFDLPTETTRCYDLVEEVLTSMIKQCPLPTERRSQFSCFTSLLRHQHEVIMGQADKEELVEQFGRALRRVRKPRMYGKDTNPSFTIPPTISSSSSSSPTSSASALSLMDLIQQGAIDNYNFDDDSIPLECSASSFSSRSKELLTDWEMHIDELYQQEREEESG